MSLFALAIIFLPIFAPVIWLPFTSGTMPTESMKPAINVGDLIFIDRLTSFSDIAVGDVIMFKDDTLPIAHRVIAHDGFQITTQGDANKHADPPITEDKYLGRVQLIVGTHALGPHFGLIVASMLSVSGIFSLSALIFFLWARQHCRSIAKPT